MKLILVVAARPNFVKAAPLTRAIDKFNNSRITNHQSPITSILVHTGQHYNYEMSQIFFQDLDMPKPDIHLGVGSGTHAEQTGKVMIEFEKVLLQEKPEMVVVFGDVNSTLAAALAAVKLHIPVAHVEAGIRSYDMQMPEEINRLLTDHISQYLFTTSKYDDASLRKEYIAKNKIFCVGNIMADSLLYNRSKASNSDILQRLGLTRQRSYALLTLHRPGNVDEEQNLIPILTTIKKIAQKIPVVFPVHPRTQKRLHEFNLDLNSQPNLLVSDPLGYLDFLNLEMNAMLVITDSGGIQVETTVLGIPCLTILDSPVWKITHEQGTNILVGSDDEKLFIEATKIIDFQSQSPMARHKLPKLWDGKTAERIVNIITNH